MESKSDQIVTTPESSIEQNPAAPASIVVNRSPIKRNPTAPATIRSFGELSPSSARLLSLSLSLFLSHFGRSMGLVCGVGVDSDIY